MADANFPAEVPAEVPDAPSEDVSEYKDKRGLVWQVRQESLPGPLGQRYMQAYGGGHLVAGVVTRQDLIAAIESAFGGKT